MNALNTSTMSSERLASTTYLEGVEESAEGAHFNFRYYMRGAGEARTVGTIATMSFSVDAPVAVVWPIFKDSNLWHNAGGYYYSGVLGDLEGRTFRLSKAPNEDGPHQYRVIKVIPEHLIIFEQPGPWEGGALPYDGYGVYELSEHDGRTTVTVLMQHANRPGAQSNEAAIGFWRPVVAAGHTRWRDVFIPTLRARVARANVSQDGKL